MPGVMMIYKLALDGRVLWQYAGRLVSREAQAVVVEAFFDREDAPFMGITLKRGDRFVETYYSGRWYNIFEIYDRDDGGLKGWYCNVAKPATIADGSVSYVDLALDLWVAADGTQTVLDEDEFEALGLDETTRQAALRGLEELRGYF